jgi:hypothetical protein
MSSYISPKLRQKLIVADNQHCAYCQTTQANSGQPMTLDHIIPQAQGGSTNFENLCFACRQCNQFKGSATTTVDPLTGETVSLYHPRRNSWATHFQWTADGIELTGLTSIGRGTIITLKINNPVICEARKRWVAVGWHPPQID